EGVGDVEGAGEAGSGVDGAVRADHLEPGPVRCGGGSGDIPVGAALGVAGGRPGGDLRVDGEAGDFGVVGTEQCPTGSFRGEQVGLGGEVLLHRVVEVKVVTAEVGEHCEVEHDAVDAPHDQGVAGDLH